MIVCFCGSLRFQSTFQEKARGCALRGVIVLQPVFGLQNLTQEQIEVLHELHRQKIKLADAVLVINPGGYIGESTKSEIQFARSLDKQIYYLEQESK